MALLGTALRPQPGTAFQKDKMHHHVCQTCSPVCVCLSVHPLVLGAGSEVQQWNSILTTPLAADAGEKNPTVRRREGVYPSPLRCMRGGFIMDFPFSHALFGSSLSCQLEPASSPGTLHHSQTLVGVMHKTQVKCSPGPPQGHI